MEQQLLALTKAIDKLKLIQNGNSQLKELYFKKVDFLTRFIDNQWNQQENFEEALETIDILLNEYPDLQTQIKCYKIRSQVYELMEDIEQAYINQEKVEELEKQMEMEVEQNKINYQVQYKQFLGCYGKAKLNFNNLKGQKRNRQKENQNEGFESELDNRVKLE